MDAHLDFETFSPTDLRKAGVHRYAEDPHTGVWGFSWCIGHGGTIRRWHPGDPDPIELLAHVQNGGMVVSHNAAFERTIWNVVLRKTYRLGHWPMLRIQQQSCTMARAAANALPQDLDTLAEVLNATHRKDREGHALMMKMSRPRKRESDGAFTWWDEPQMVGRLAAYQDQDVRVEDGIDAMLPPLTDHERRVWELDQTINERGIAADVASIMRAADVVLAAKRDADRKMRKLTDGAISKCTETKKIIEWINARGINCDTLRKGNQDELIAMAEFADDPLVREVIELRKEAAKTSTSKYAKMLDCVCADGRIRGLLNYCGAGRTGRWAGRLVQPQNFPRLDPDWDGDMVNWMSYLLQQPVPASECTQLVGFHGAKVDNTYQPFQTLPALAKSLRAMIIAEPGNKLLGGDFSNIEGRKNAWLAGETWKLDAFRAYDNGTGPDLYKLAYSRSFGVPVETIGKGQKRQIGKVQELALGYQGGIGALITMGDTYGMKMHDLVKPVREAATAQQWDETAIRYSRSSDKFGLPEAVWTAGKIIVTNWRAANSKIVQGWWDCADAAIAAVDEPGQVFACYGGRVKYMAYNNYLYCQLPSGRALCYANPHIRDSVQTLVNKDGEEYERVKRTVWFVGLDSVTRQWKEMYLYGGHQCENIVQASSRCLMDHAMFRVEAAGYPLVLTVHDELLAEVQKEFGSVAEFRGLMAELPVWAKGLPVDAAAWEDTRYVK